MAEKKTHYLVDGKYSIRDLVNLERLRKIFEKFSVSTGFTIGFLEHPSRDILITTGWLDICTKFHRVHPESLECCIKSNIKLTGQLEETGGIVIEECENGLMDCAVPIFIKGKHVASLATGQLLIAEPDTGRFIKQARKYGYDADQYLKALKEVRVVPEEKLLNTVSFLQELASFIAELGLNNLEIKEQAAKLENEIVEREKIKEKLETGEIRFHELFDNMSSGVAVYKTINGGRDFIIVGFNKMSEIITGAHKAEVIGKSVVEVFPAVKEFGLFDVFQRVWKTGKPESHPASFYKDENLEFWVENYVYKLPCNDIVAVYDDITVKKE